MRPNRIRPEYEHDRWVTKPTEIVRHFEAFVVSFDSKADDGAAWGIPDFVAYEIKRYPGTLAKAPEKRPSDWMSEPALVSQGISPKDDTYEYPKPFLEENKDWFERGHMCMKHHAWRLGGDADWNTHTVLNAAPQRGSLNRGAWREVEDLTATWADAYERVWIVAGPIVEGRRPKAYLGEPGEMAIVIPDAFFKIVIKVGNGRPDVLAFRFPQTHPKYSMKPRPLEDFLVTVDSIEAETGLDFLTILSDTLEAAIEREKATALWLGKNLIAGRN